jgi:peptidoglycan/LPS O-acetylase OafA/YrhL
MILWSSKKIERALAGGDLDAWTKVKYLIIPAILGTLSEPFYIIRPLYGKKPPALNSMVTFIFSILMAYLTYWGIRKCFRENNQIDSNMFFERYAVLGVPILVRLIAIFTPVTIIFMTVVYGVHKRHFPESIDNVSIYVSAIGPIVTYITYQMLSASFCRLGELIKTENIPNHH